MELGESLEDTAKRGTRRDRTSHHRFTVTRCFSGPDCYLKVSNGDELYAVTAVFYTRNVLGNLVIDYNESETMQYFSLYHLPNDLKDRRYIEPYIAQLI